MNFGQDSEGQALRLVSLLIPPREKVTFDNLSYVAGKMRLAIVDLIDAGEEEIACNLVGACLGEFQEHLPGRD